MTKCLALELLFVYVTLDFFRSDLGLVLLSAVACPLSFISLLAVTSTPQGLWDSSPGCAVLTVRMGKSLQGKQMLPFALSRPSRVNPLLWITVSAPGTSRRDFSHNGKQLVGNSFIRKPTPESRMVARFHQFLHQLQKSNSFFWVP